MGACFGADKSDLEKTCNRKLHYPYRTADMREGDRDLAYLDWTKLKKAMVASDRQGGSCGVGGGGGGGGGGLPRLKNQRDLDAILKNPYVIIVSSDHSNASESLVARVERLSQQPLSVDVKFAKCPAGADFEPGDEWIRFKLHPHTDFIRHFDVIPLTRCFKDGVQCRPDVPGDSYAVILKQVDMWRRGESWQPEQSQAVGVDEQIEVLSQAVEEQTEE